MDAAEDDQITPLPNLSRRRSQRRTRPQSVVSLHTEGEMNDLADYMSSSVALGSPVIDTPSPYTSHFGEDPFDPTLFTTRKSLTTPNSPVSSAANSSSESLNRPNHFSDSSTEHQLQLPPSIRPCRSRISTDSMPGLTASINSVSTGRFTSPGPTTPVISLADLPSPDHLAIIDERRLSDDHDHEYDEEEEHGHGHSPLDHHVHDHEDHQREEDDHEHDDDHLDNDPFPPLREKELRASPTTGTRLHIPWPQKKPDIHWLHTDPISRPLSPGGGRRHHVSMDGAAVSQASLVSTKTTTTTRAPPSFARFFKKGEDKSSEEEREEKKRMKKEEAKATREKMRAEKAQRELEVMPMPMVMMGGGRGF